MARFIHLSDLHIHTRNKEENKNCRKLIAFIKHRYAMAEKRPLVLITGDIVHGDITRPESFPEQYENAKNLLRPLVNEFDVIVTPGNHDDAHNGLEFNRESYDLFHKVILGELLGVPGAEDAAPVGPHVYPLTRVEEGVLFVALDSAIGNHKDAFQFARGALGEKQIHELRVILEANAKGDKHRVVACFHHHPFMRTDLTMKMDDGDEVMGVMENVVDVLCFGHKHVSESWQGRRGIEWILASGKSTKPNDSGRLQFREVEIGPDHEAVNMVSFKP
ncbi:metallophosphoesterase family protein [Desulfocurvus sp. DL9XJH121]